MPTLFASCKVLPSAQTSQPAAKQDNNIQDKAQTTQSSQPLSETPKLPDLPAVHIEENIEQAKPAKLYTLCVRDADIRDVLMSLGKEGNISIIIDPDIDIEKEPIEETEIKDLSRDEYEESVTGTGFRRGFDTEGAERDLGKHIEKRWTEKRRTKLVTADLKDVTLFEALDALLTPLSLEYKDFCNIPNIFVINNL